MKKNILLVSIFLILSNCITIVKKNNPETTFPFSKPFKDQAFFIKLKSETFSGEEIKVDPKYALQTKSGIEGNFNTYKFLYLPKIFLENVDDFEKPNDYNYKIYINSKEKLSLSGMIGAFTISVLSAYLIPTWNSYSAEIEIKLIDKKGKEVLKEKYENEFTNYRQLFLLFAMPFFRVNPPDITKESLEDFYIKIHNQKLIEISEPIKKN